MTCKKNVDCSCSFPWLRFIFITGQSWFWAGHESISIFVLQMCGLCFPPDSRYDWNVGLDCRGGRFRFWCFAGTLHGLESRMAQRFVFDPIGFLLFDRAGAPMFFDLGQLFRSRSSLFCGKELGHCSHVGFVAANVDIIGARRLCSNHAEICVLCFLFGPFSLCPLTWGPWLSQSNIFEWRDLRLRCPRRIWCSVVVAFAALCGLRGDSIDPTTFGERFLTPQCLEFSEFLFLTDDLWIMFFQESKEKAPSFHPRDFKILTRDFHKVRNYRNYKLQFREHCEVILCILIPRVLLVMLAWISAFTNPMAWVRPWIKGLRKRCADHADVSTDPSNPSNRSSALSSTSSTSSTSPSSLSSLQA